MGRRRDVAFRHFRSRIEHAVLATGNPWPDFAGKPRLGEDLYTCSVIALDLDTGKMKWFYQFTPHDVHDWDAESWPMLLTVPWQDAGGQTTKRKVVVHANRNGFYYVLDRDTGKFLRNPAHR